MSKKEELPKVILIPARFTQVIPQIDLLTSAPISDLLGVSDRKKTLNEYSMSRSAADIEVSLAPQSSIPSLVHGRLSLPISGKTVGVPTGGLDVVLSSSLPSHFKGSARLGVDSTGGVTGTAYVRRKLGQSDISESKAVDTYMRFGSGVFTVGSRIVGNTSLLGVEHSMSAATVPPTSLVYGVTTIGDVRAGAQIIIDDCLTFPYEAHVTLLNSSEAKASPISSLTVSLLGKKFDATPTVTLGFHQKIVSARRILNPLENPQATQIANYIDCAFEATHKPSGLTELAAGASWQWNKNWLMKVRLSTCAGISSTIACKSWWNPTLTAAFTGGARWDGLYAGLMLKLQNTGDSVFRGVNLNDSPDSIYGNKWQELPKVDKTGFHQINKLYEYTKTSGLIL